MCTTAARGVLRRERSMSDVDVGAECLGGTVGVVMVTQATQDASTGHAVETELKSLYV